MKVNEFVKEHGWEYAKHILTDDAPLVMDLNYTDLKRLVESHDLVDKVGGMDKAKLLLRMRIAAELYESADEIEKAILDVESCQ